MGKWIACALALGAVAAPGSALAHHGGAADIAAGIGAGAVAMAMAAGLLTVGVGRGCAWLDRTPAGLAATLRPSIRR